MSHLAHLSERWRPDAVLVRTPEGDLTGAHLADRIRAAAGWLRGLGLGPGDRIALQTHREPAFLAVHLAALGLGVGTVALNPRGGVRDVTWPLADAAPRVAVLLDPAVLERAGAHPVSPDLVVLPADDLAEALAGATPIPVPALDGGDVPAPETEALVGYTSGTTGRPKGARILHRNLTATVTALHDAWAFTPDDVLVHALPLFHIHGLVVAQHVALRAGARTVWLPGFDAAEAWGALEREQATVFMGVPTFYQRFLDLPALDAPPSMRLFTSGSAPLPARVHEAFEARTGHRILERYGMTEVGIVLSNPWEGDRRPGSVGLPLPGVEVRVVDPATDTPVPDGTIGEVQVRGPSVFAGYLHRPEATAAALAGGWMHTGDHGFREPDGYVHLRGRRSDLILVGGFNVYPLEVEAVLREHPSVADAAVVAVEDADLGQRPVATVVTRTPIDPEVLRDHARAHLSAYKVPWRIALVEALPRNAMNKVDKGALRGAWATPTLRRAGPGHVDRLVRGNLALAAETEDLHLDADTVRRGVTGGLERDDVRQYVLCLHDDVVVGQTMVTTEWSDWRAREVWWLQSVWLEPAVRGRGLFRRVYQQLRDAARTAGAAGLRLYVDRRNEAAAAVYEALGMDGDHYRLYEDLLGPRDDGDAPS